jgi:hypothetical protein
MTDCGKQSLCKMLLITETNYLLPRIVNDIDFAHSNKSANSQHFPSHKFRISKALKSGIDRNTVPVYNNKTTNPDNRRII